MKRCINCGMTENNDEMLFCSFCGNKLAEIEENRTVEEDEYSWGNSVSASPISKFNDEEDKPKYCMNCGIPFNEYGVCIKCGNRQSEQMRALTVREPYWNKLLECVRVLFSSSPFNGIENAGRETGHKIWPICSSFFVVCSSLGFANILCRQSETYIGVEMSLAEMYGIAGAFGGVLLKTLLVIVSFFFTSTAALSLLMKVSGTKLPFIQLMNINSFSLIPTSLISLFAFIVAFISKDLALFILPVGVLMTVVMLYYAIQKIAKFKRSPFWYFAVTMGANSVICFLIAFVVNTLF